MNFSVLMSVYHKDNPIYLKQALDSIINQTYKPSEIVLVKDGPLTKELDNVISEYEKQYINLFVIVALEFNKGLGDALQAGLLKCKNEIVARMDSDDICVNDRFEKQIKIFKSDYKLALVGSAIDEFIENPQNQISRRVVPCNNNEIEKYIKQRCPFNHVTVMFRKSIILSVGGYIKWFYNEDYSLWVRLIASGAKTFNLPESLVHVRVNMDTYGRRGGRKYFKSEEAIQRDMLKRKMISPFRYMFNTFLRFIIQVIIPNKVRAYLYKKIFRK